MMSKTNDDRATFNHAWMEMAFLAIQRGSDEFGLLPCRVNGYPSAAICMGRALDGGKMEVMPLFVAYTEGIDIEFPTREAAKRDGPRQRPRADTIERQFKVTLAAMTEQHHPR